MTTTKNYDWELVKIQYIQGKDTEKGLEWPTLEQLAFEYEIPTSTVRARAARENWTEQRNEYATLLVQKTREKTLEKVAEKASQLDIQALNVARAALALHSKELIEGTQSGELGLADRERLLKMCDTAHRMGRRALGFGSNTD